jgi:hypothetical protein
LKTLKQVFSLKIIYDKIQVKYKHHLKLITKDLKQFKTRWRKVSKIIAAERGVALMAKARPKLREISEKRVLNVV